MVNSQRFLLSGISLSGNRHIKCRDSLALQISEPRTLMVRVLSPRHVTSSSTLSRIAGSRFHRPQFLCTIKSRMSNPDFAGSRATCPLSINGSNVIGKSPIVISTVMKILSPGNPICRVPISLNSFLYLRVKSLAASPKSNDQRDFAILLCEPWPLILFLYGFSK